MGTIYFAQESALGLPRVSTDLRPALPLGLIKVGHTTKPVGERLLGLSRSVKRSISLIGTIDGTCAQECAMHRRFTPFRAHAGWGLEWYLPTTELRAVIAALLRRDLSADDSGNRAKLTDDETADATEPDISRAAGS